ncbi:MAG: hypothetical protein H8D26_09380 [Methanomicrobia archaeon]|nr:hypothetical protein [Methanomicrobia archaeon]
MKTEIMKGSKLFSRIIRLNEYLREYAPQKWLFPRAKHGKHINTRTVEKIFTAAYGRAGIRKEARRR